MLKLLKIVSLVIAGAWSLLRGTEEALAFWVRHAARSRDLDDVAWA